LLAAIFDIRRGDGQGFGVRRGSAWQSLTAAAAATAASQIHHEALSATRRHQMSLNARPLMTD